MYQKRIDSLLKKTGGITFLDNKPENLFYFSGFTGDSGYIILSEMKCVLITSKMFQEQAFMDVPQDIFEIEICENSQVHSLILETLTELGTSEIVFSSKNISLGFFKNLVNKAKEKRFFGVGKKLVSFRKDSFLLGDVIFHIRDDIDQQVRMIKDKSETEVIKSNMCLSDEGFLYILTQIRSGMTENELAFELEYYLRKKGADGLSFSTIVASGKRSSMPHGIASDKIILSNEPIIIDFGIKKDRYCTDTTRTVFVGDPSQEFKDVYNLVLDAMNEAISVVKEGICASEVDEKARRYIERYGYSEFFFHSTGHGVGLEIHESPRISDTSKEILLEGMVHTVEPGIYLPGKFGVRIENMVLVKKTGSEILSSLPAELMII